MFKGGSRAGRHMYNMQSSLFICENLFISRKHVTMGPTIFMREGERERYLFLGLQVTAQAEALWPPWRDWL